MDIDLNSLVSRVVRTQINQQSGGIRKIKTALSQKDDEQQGDGGLVDTIGNAAKWVINKVSRFVGFALGKVWDLVKRFVNWSLSSLWGLAVSSFQFLWNFNWNQTDEELDKYIQTQYDALIVQAAGGLGQALGWLVCGALPGVVMFTFNEALGAHILKEVGEEALEELAPILGGLIRATLRTVGRHALVSTYKRMRSWLVGNNPMYDKSDEEMQRDLNAQYGQAYQRGEYPTSQAAQDALKKDLEKRKRVRDAAKSGFKREPWSFQKKFEEWREDTFPKEWQNAIEEFIEEFSDACIEAGYVVAGSLDSYYAHNKLMAPAIVGNQQMIMIDFDRELSKERAAKGLDPATGLPLTPGATTQ